MGELGIYFGAPRVQSVVLQKIKINEIKIKIKVNRHFWNISAKEIKAWKKQNPIYVVFFKDYNICSMEILESKEIQKGTEKIFKVIMAEIFPKLMTSNKPSFLEAQITPG